VPEDRLGSAPLQPRSSWKEQARTR
jgi:hypothetical protein